jgi:hypothetical protein
LFGKRTNNYGPSWNSREIPSFLIKIIAFTPLTSKCELFKLTTTTTITTRETIRGEERRMIN